MQERRQRGTALVIMIILGTSLMVLAAVSVNMTLMRSAARESQREVFLARQIAESAAAQALARLREGGILTPRSGSGPTASWVPFSDGDMYYSTTYDASTEISTIRAWGRVAVDDGPSASTAAPDDPAWNGDGWLVRGVEITVQGGVFVPEFPIYFGNGGIEAPLGGFAWTGSSNPGDPSSWGTVNSSPSSYQTGTIPFEASALDYPPDYVQNGGSPAPALAPHPYKIMASQTVFGQFNTEAWFTNSAGAGADPTTKLSPPPVAPYYDTGDPDSPDYPYPYDPSIPDVQEFAWALWNAHKDDASAVKLGSGSHSGTYGDLSNPGITFVSGELEVPAGSTFEGAGILVIRDPFDPNVDTNNTPTPRAGLSIDGTFRWTGLVIIAGWAPSVDVAAGGDSTIVGSFFGEDSVQSGGEISLDSATIIMRIRGPFRLLYSSALFAPGGMIHDSLPPVNKTVVGIRELTAGGNAVVQG